MPTPSFQPPDGVQNGPQMVDYIYRLIRDLNYLLNNLDDLNISRLDAKVIIAHTITAAMLNVTELSAITANMGTLTSGEIYGAYIATANGTYPRIEFSSTGNLFTAYNDANNYIALNPNTVSADPFIYFYSSGIVADIRINSFSGIFSLTAEQGISVSSSNDNVLLTASSGSIYASSSGGTVLDVPSEIINAQADASSALAGLSGKQDSFSGYTGTQTVVESVNFGASTTVTKTLHFSNGVLTSIT